MAVPATHSAAIFAAHPGAPQLDLAAAAGIAASRSLAFQAGQLGVVDRTDVDAK